MPARPLPTGRPAKRNFAPKSLAIWLVYLTLQALETVTGLQRRDGKTNDKSLRTTPTRRDSVAT